MTALERPGLSKILMTTLAVIAVVGALFAGCAQIQDRWFPAPTVPAEWNALLSEIRAFERRLGFRETKNFKQVYAEKSGYTICGYAPRLRLPHSYEDPLIRWSNVTHEPGCRDGAANNDFYFAQIEAVGEIGVGLTPGMLEGKLDRFLYLVIHEDCHDQFDFPFGFEEALCNLIGYKGMAEFAAQKYGAHSREGRAVRGYVETQAHLTRAVVSHYGDVARLYERHARGEITAEGAMNARVRLLAGAERTLGWQKNTMNNVGLANEMTYSRHYPMLDDVFEALGGDLEKVMAFFTRVDRAKPAREALLKRLGISDDKSVQAVMALEASAEQEVTRQLRLSGLRR